MDKGFLILAITWTDHFYYRLWGVLFLIVHCFTFHEFRLAAQSKFMKSFQTIQIMDFMWTWFVELSVTYVVLLI